MGKLTTVVLCGFLFIHIAEILNIVSVATPRWLVSNSTFNGTGGEMEAEYYKGLWTFCAFNTCTTINSTQQQVWFRASQALDVLGVGLCTLALILTYAFLLATSCKNSKGTAWCNAGVQVVSATCLLVVAILFGVNGKKHHDGLQEFPSDVTIKMDWSYDVGVAGMVMTWLSAIAAMREACYLANRRADYENI